MVKGMKGRLIIASQDPYCFQRIFLTIQYKAISLLLTSDILRTVWTGSLQDPIIKIGARQNEWLSFQIVALIFPFCTKCSVRPINRWIMILSQFLLLQRLNWLLSFIFILFGRPAFPSSSAHIIVSSSTVVLCRSDVCVLLLFLTGK